MLFPVKGLGKYLMPQKTNLTWQGKKYLIRGNILELKIHTCLVIEKKKKKKEKKKEREENRIKQHRPS